MELVHGKSSKVSKFIPEDFISRMPEDVITNILDRLPIQNAVGTAILSKKWRSKWTMLTELVFDQKFFNYLLIKPHVMGNSYYRIISRLLLQLKGPITKFLLYIPYLKALDAEDIYHWVLILSKKGLKELILQNMASEQLPLPTQLFACKNLKHMNLRKCYFCHSPTICGSPYLLSLDLYMVNFENYRYGEFIASCPLLETLVIGPNFMPFHFHEVKLKDIEKLKNLKMFSLPLCLLDNPTMIKYSSIFKLMGHLPKLQELCLEFQRFKFLAEDGAEKNVPADFPSLKTLTLNKIDFSSDIMVSFVSDMICGSPNLQTLKITATYNNDVPPTALFSSVLDCNTMRQMQLRSVVFEDFRGCENEVCLIKYVLACSPLLKKIVIRSDLPSLVGGDSGKFKFARKLLQFHRASTVAEIDLD